MLCTSIVTARIAIWLNPLVCKLWQEIIPKDDFLWEDCPSVAAVSWFLTILSIVAICVIVYGFNKATAYAFGEKK